MLKISGEIVTQRELVERIPFALTHKRPLTRILQHLQG